MQSPNRTEVRECDPTGNQRLVEVFERELDSTEPADLASRLPSRTNPATSPSSTSSQTSLDSLKASSSRARASTS